MNFQRAEILKTENIAINQIRIILQIIKIRITFLVSLTTALGYFVGANEISIKLVYVVIGIFLLACSSAALNHLQEKDFDSKMCRTENRPLPSGTISSANVIFISVLLFVSGGLLLLIKVNLEAFIIGFVTLIWYNAVYTPLKKHSAFAVIPGSLVGALPPLAGWASVQGFYFDYRIFYLCLYFFIWQIPHFWLLLMIYGEDYKKAGYPVLNDIFNGNKLRYITFLWILLCLIFGFGISFSGIIFLSISKVFISGISVISAVFSTSLLLKKTNRKKIIANFILINIYTLIIILTISFDKIFTLLK